MRDVWCTFFVTVVVICVEDEAYICVCVDDEKVLCEMIDDVCCRCV